LKEVKKSEIIWNEHIVEGTLNGEKVRFKCKYWSKDIYVEQRIKEIKRNIREIEMIAFDERERCWIYDAMHKKISWKGGLDWW
jgi:hypothetical protein